MLTQTISRAFSQVVLKANKNQARELGDYAIEFMKNGNPSVKVLERCKLFHTDSVFCGLSALALKTNAPTILAYEYINKILAKKPNHWQPEEQFKNQNLDLPKFSEVIYGCQPQMQS